MPCVYIGTVVLSGLMLVVSSTALHRVAKREIHDEMTQSYVEVWCDSTAGPFQIEIYEGWSPLGAERFLEMVDGGFFDGQALWRAVPHFVVQFGIPATLEKRQEILKKPALKDDPHLNIPFLDGTLSFAGSGKNSRREEVFLSLGHQRRLGRSPWETPFGRIIRKQGLNSLHQIYTGYGDMPYFGGHGPESRKIWKLGNSYLKENFPHLDYLETCKRSGNCTLREDGWALCDCAEGFIGSHCHTKA